MSWKKFLSRIRVAKVFSIPNARQQRWQMMKDYVQRHKHSPVGFDQHHHQE